jgi:transposase
MTAPYSIDLRERALVRKAAGETNREIAAALSISPSCVSKWTKRKQESRSRSRAWFWCKILEFCTHVACRPALG